VDWLGREPVRLVTVGVLLGALSQSLYVVNRCVEEHVKSRVLHEDRRQVGQWLAAHAPGGSVVVQTNWDQFPELFFYAYQCRFLNGFDPVDSYVVNPSLFWRWSHLVWDGTWCDHATCPEPPEVPQDPAVALATLLRQEFAADYLAVIGRWPSATLTRLAADPRVFEPVFRTSLSAVYRVRHTPKRRETKRGADTRDRGE